MEYREIEVRFLNIDKEALIQKLEKVGAEDLGESMLDERIIYDEAFTWRDGLHKILRLRTVDGTTHLTYKHRTEITATGTEEIEFEVGNIDAAEALLQRLGYVAFRHQQKLRHTFRLGEVLIEIDTWPRVPAYVELEGPSEEALKETAKALGLNWDTVEMRSPRTVIEDVYNIPVGQMRWFTFDRFE